MEQRMARYKEKYGKTASQPMKSGGKQESLAVGAQAAAKGKGKRPSSEALKERAKPEAAQGGAKPKGRVASAEGGAKGGLIARILGIFKKSKDGQ
jgi:hypothetical protein